MALNNNVARMSLLLFSLVDTYSNRIVNVKYYIKIRFRDILLCQASICETVHKLYS